MTDASILRMKVFLADAAANGYVWFGAVASWQADFDYWIKIMAGISAIAVSWITIYLKLKNKNKE